MRKRKEPTAPAPPTPTKQRQAKTAPQPVVTDQLLTITETARRLGLGRTKVYELINENLLPYVEIPGKGESMKRISAQTLNTWIRERETVKHAS